MQIHREPGAKGTDGSEAANKTVEDKNYLKTLQADLYDEDSAGAKVQQT